MRQSALVLALALITTSALAEQHPKLAPELKGRHNQSTVDVIVQFHKQAQSSAMTAKIVGKGGKVQHDLSYIHALHTFLPASRIAELEKDGDVEYISPNRHLETLLSNSAGAVNANYAWTLGLDGSSVGVAIMDSGIHVNNDLQAGPGKKTSSRVIANFDMIGDGTDDKFGHGTHVAGIVAGNGAGSSCATCNVHFRGIASGANLISFRVLDENGQGSDASVINAIHQAIALKNQYNIRVINLSLGRPVFESYTRDPLCQAVEAAWKAGIVVIVAAGNDGRDNTAGTNGYGTISAPGNDPYVITVGAMNTMGTPDRADDIMTSYSSKGQPRSTTSPNLTSLLQGIRSYRYWRPLGLLYPNNFRLTAQPWEPTKLANQETCRNCRMITLC